jgi:TetR/AcrR family transcriptional regulator, transcriptional repressor for nem operon
MLLFSEIVMASSQDTVQRILDVSQQMLQVRGYNALTYQDVAEAIGLQDSNIEAYFPLKSDLAKALIVRYRKTFAKLQDQIDQNTDRPIQKLIQFADLYFDGLRSGRMCLCGMLAEDITVLPPELQREVLTFFDENEAWLVQVITDGVRLGVMAAKGAIEIEAKLLLIGLQGAQLMARAYSQLELFQQIAQRLIAGLAAPQDDK